MGEHKLNDQKQAGTNLDVLDTCFEVMIQAVLEQALGVALDVKAPIEEAGIATRTVVVKIEGTMYPIHRRPLRLAYERVMRKFAEGYGQTMAAELQLAEEQKESPEGGEEES